MENNFEMGNGDFEQFLNAHPTQLNSWLDKEYLNLVVEDLVNLNDYVPLTLILLLPDSGARKRFVVANMDLRNSNDYFKKQLLDQSPNWEDYVSGYDNFFKCHPEFLKLIKDKDAYEYWRLNEVDYLDECPYEYRNEYKTSDYFDVDRLFEYREKITLFFNKVVVEDFDEIVSCTIQVLPDFLDWDLQIILGYENLHIKSDKLEMKIRDILFDYCKEIEANDYYLFILISFSAVN